MIKTGKAPKQTRRKRSEHLHVLDSLDKVGHGTAISVPVPEGRDPRAFRNSLMAFVRRSGVSPRDGGVFSSVIEGVVVWIKSKECM